MSTIEQLMTGFGRRTPNVLEQIEMGLFPKDSKGRPQVTTRNKMKWSIVATDRVGDAYPLLGINLNASPGGGHQVWMKDGRASLIQKLSEYDIIPLEPTRQKINGIRTKVEVDVGTFGRPSLEIEFSVDRISFETFRRNNPTSVVLSRVIDREGPKIGDVIETKEGHARYKMIAVDVPGPYPLTGYLMQTNDWSKIGEIKQWTKEGYFDESRMESSMNLDLPKNEVITVAATPLTRNIPFERMPYLKLKVELPKTNEKFDKLYRALTTTLGSTPEIWTIHFDGYYPNA